MLKIIFSPISFPSFHLHPLLNIFNPWLSSNFLSKTFPSTLYLFIHAENYAAVITSATPIYVW